jgi:tetratricopeptide (TPR) repeat protein
MAEVTASQNSIQSKSRPRSWRRIILVVLIVAAILAVVAYKHGHNRIAVERKIEIAETSNQYSQANALIKQQITKVATKKQKANLYSELGANYMNSGDYNHAIAAYNQAASTNGMTVSIALALANAYQKQGNNQQAMDSYEKALQLWPKDDPGYQSEVRYIQEVVRKLLKDSPQ